MVNGMGNTLWSACAGGAILICNELVERQLLSWWLAVPLIMASAFVLARIWTARRRANGR